MFIMNKASTETRVLITKALIDGVGVNATSRLSGAAKNTILKLLAQLGEACAAYHEKHVRNVKSSRIQCDEIWSFCYAKQKNVPDQFKGVFGFGDCWTWTALDQDSKLMISYMLGWRDGACRAKIHGRCCGPTGQSGATHNRRIKVLSGRRDECL